MIDFFLKDSTTVLYTLLMFGQSTTFRERVATNSPFKYALKTADLI